MSPRFVFLSLTTATLVFSAVVSRSEPIEQVISTNGFSIEIPFGKALVITATTFKSIRVDQRTNQYGMYVEPSYRLQGYAPSGANSAREERRAPSLIAGPLKAVFGGDQFEELNSALNQTNRKVLFYSMVTATNLATASTRSGFEIPANRAAHILNVLTSDGFGPLSISLRIGDEICNGYSPSGNDILKGPLQFVAREGFMDQNGLITYQIVPAEMAKLGIETSRDLSQWLDGGIRLFPAEGDAAFFRLKLSQ